MGSRLLMDWLLDGLRKVSSMVFCVVLYVLSQIPFDCMNRLMITY